MASHWPGYGVLVPPTPRWCKTFRPARTELLAKLAVGLLDALLNPSHQTASLLDDHLSPHASTRVVGCLDVTWHKGFVCELEQKMRRESRFVGPSRHYDVYAEYLSVEPVQQAGRGLVFIPSANVVRQESPEYEVRREWIFRMRFVWRCDGEQHTRPLVVDEMSRARWICVKIEAITSWGGLTGLI